MEPIRFDRDIRPILSDRCFKCHGPDTGSRQADLRLDQREPAVAQRDGVTAIVPGRLEASDLWRRVRSDDPKELMPPPDSNKRPLAAEELERVRRWIEQGAEYEPHWSFAPPARPVEPPVARDAWCRTPVDRFILTELDKHGIDPSPEADREALMRRMFLDLTGLPPTPEEISAFLADERGDAYERWVDKVLTEEPYRTRHAERLAGPWLDASRYADTCGIHMDAGRQIWPWRDWVLNALRDNMPFDRFVIEQLAGDLLPDATRNQKIASGFNRNHVTTDEGGAIAEEYLVEYAVDRTATVGSVFLGMTLGCARCHEHKFDPVSQDEFFSLYAFFNSIEEPGLYSQLPDPIRAFEPFMPVPSPQQEAELASLKVALAASLAELDNASPEEASQLAEFLAQTPRRAGVSWATPRLVSAVSTGGATLTVQPDGSILASGSNPKQDDFVLTLQTSETDLRVLMLEALTDPSLPAGRVGRAFNGNAVLTGVEAEAVSIADPAQRQSIRFVWAWADGEQADGDHAAVNLLDTTDELGWAVDAHRRADGRVALLLAEAPFGFPGGTELVIRLQHRSIYAEHTLGRVRVTPGRISDEGLALLPAAVSGWHVVGPFPVADRGEAFNATFGPEQERTLDLKKNFGSGNPYWRHDFNLRDEQLNPLVDGVNVTYLARRVFSPTCRGVDVSLGSDDGIRVFLDGEEVFAREVERGVAADQDRTTLHLRPGAHVLTLKIVNTGGAAGFYHKALPREGELTRELTAALLPESSRDESLRTRLAQAWKLNFSPGYRQKKDHIASLEKRSAEIEAAVPKTMIMKELPAPRPTFVLTRGQYDKPDPARPVSRGLPAFLGKLPDDAPRDRLGLARWLMSKDNPLTARVIVNRFWEMLFGTGIVRTSEDFGLQGEWPSHPELLDWLAVEFRESGWDVRHMLRLMVTSATYRQSSRVRPEARQTDPDNRLLAYFPRRRLAAEQVRDQALYVSGLLVEKLGGPSVKPYQPEGLWQEVAMPQSNTREFVRGAGADLYRRSLYTYWKRACPPPNLMAFDAPTRESCTIRRTSTHTPLQALTLWNDVQFVEAARALAQRTLSEGGDDEVRMTRLFARCLSRAPDADELGKLLAALAEFRARYAASLDDAGKLVALGETPAPADMDRAELAAWTMLANAILNLSAVTTQG
ncbi:MAG: PSD1 domain-containing protein [Phycisphaerales bacterium]|nr:PSD1 domain-containing protein [Phycisphaerales bacterium]